jgi:hypothetical protein
MAKRSLLSGWPSYIFLGCVCSFSYPVYEEHAPYYILPCGLSGSTTYLQIINRTISKGGGGVVERQRYTRNIHRFICVAFPIVLFFLIVLLSLCAMLLAAVGLLCILLLSCVYLCYYLVCIFVTSCILFYYVCIAVLHTLVARLLARSQYPEGPATGHLGTGFSCFPCVCKRMLRWFPTLQVATACFSCSPPELNFLDPYFIFMLSLFHIYVDA